MEQTEQRVLAEKEKSDRCSRMVWADAARSFAILCVVLCHTAEAVFGFDPVLLPQYQSSMKLQVLAFFLFTAGRLGVPVFLFLSGFLLMDREYPDAQSVAHFWKTHLCSLWCTTQCARVACLFPARALPETCCFWNTAMDTCGICLPFWACIFFCHLWHVPCAA